MKYFLCFLMYFSVSMAQIPPAYFTDISEEARFTNTGNNSGVSMGDYDSDGDDDLYVSVRDGRNRLFKNMGTDVFKHVELEAGVGFEGNTLMSVWGDLDNDGDLDLFLGNYDEPNILYRNNGDGTFEDVSLPAGIANSNRVQAVTMGDIDQDGWLDIYVANLSEQNYLYKNNGDMTFSNVVFESGTTDMLVAMGTIFFDYDNDKDLDLYLTHDAYQPCILYENDGTGKFTDVSQASGTNVGIQGMGVDVGDFDHNGFLDIYITNLGANVLLMNNGDKTFTNVAGDAGVDNTGMGWGTVCFDYNNDTWEDIYMVNNYNFAPSPNRLYHNKGDGTFEVVSYDTPLEVKKVGYGTACSDLNGDGSVDIALTNWNNEAALQLFRNEIGGNNWIKIKATGTISNRSAIGTRVQIYHGEVMQMDEVMAGSSWASQNSLILHFGLADATSLDSVMIRWPNGLEEMYYDLEVNETYHFTESEGFITSIDNEHAIVENFDVFPNPLQSDSHIEVSILQPEQVRLSLYDAKGQLVRTVFEGELQLGKHAFEVGTLEESGVYFCRLEYGGNSQVKKLIVW